MSSNENPGKNEIQQIFKRLRSVQANKICFDCGAKNPTWSSITYGIFICIDCSGIHRSLGVHLTFVRSTQLDSNWTWQQIRQMQLGGNANATTFFRSHNCMSNDAQQKYKSRAAQLYRDKLHSMASQAMRLHGTKLFIEAAQNTPAGEDKKEEDTADFFESHSGTNLAALDQETSDDNSSTAVSQASKFSELENSSLPESCCLSDSYGNKNGKDLEPGEGPNVDAALNAAPAAKAEPRKSTIGARKPAGKKLGAKKGGLGAQKVKKDFAEIEREAEMADQVRSRMEEERREAVKKTAEDEAKAAASMRLAYQEMSLTQKKTEEKIRAVDPKKAKELERLGMGVGGKSSGISHNAITEMSTITQEEPRGGMGSRSMFNSAPKSRFDDHNDDQDDFEAHFGGFDRPKDTKPWRTSNAGSDMDSGSNSNWEKEFEVLKSTKTETSSRGSKDEWNNNFQSSNDDSKRNRPSTLATSSSSKGDEAQNKFGGAKAISSDMYFGSENNGGTDANMSRFSGSSSISSAEYFNRSEVTPGERAGYNYGASITTPDMDDVKDSVKQGVNKVAGKLSNMASGVMSQLQDRYGY